MNPKFFLNICRRRLAKILCIVLIIGAVNCFGKNNLKPQTISDGGTTYFVSPDGSPDGNGKKKKPWDLATALAHPKELKPGDTILLRGGTYSGKYVSSLTGTAS